ncbi:MAG: radical SAM protein [Candidatus Nitrosocaldaceae archaeon]
MNKIKTLKILSKWAANNMIGKRKPLIAVIGITHFCNYYCPMCPYGDANKEQQVKYAREHDLSTQEWKRIIDKIAEECIAIIIEGGEPLTRKDMIELLLYANAKIPVIMITNGSLLHTIDLDRLRGLYSICCSIDSVKKDAYCKIRGVNEELYYRVMDNVRLLSRHKINRYINSVITKWNTEEFITQEYFDYVKNELDVHTISMTFVQNRVGGVDLLPDRKSMEEVCISILDYMKRHRDPTILMPEAYWEQILRYGRGIFDECGVWKSIVIEPDGGVAPCWKFSNYKVSLLKYEIDEIYSMSYWQDIKGCKECNTLGCVWYSSQKSSIAAKNYLRILASNIRL